MARYVSGSGITGRDGGSRCFSLPELGVKGDRGDEGERERDDLRRGEGFVLRLGVEVEGLMILRRVFRFGVCHARVTRRPDVLVVEGFLATALQ